MQIDGRTDSVNDFNRWTAGIRTPLKIGNVRQTKPLNLKEKQKCYKPILRHK